MENKTYLSPQHLQQLRESTISDAVIEARGYRTIDDPGELKALGFAAAQRRAPGLLLPLRTTDGGNGLYVYRPDNPRVIEDRTKRDPDGQYHCDTIKYEIPKGSGVRLDCPPVCLPMMGNPAIPLWITEGQKKADALASQGLCSIALLGVTNYVGKNEFGGKAVLADWKFIAMNGREARIVFDSDVMVNPNVQRELNTLTEILQRKGAHVAHVYLPGGDGHKIGVDDFLAAGNTIKELEALVGAPRPEVKAVAPTYELLDVAPPILRRPLCLSGDHAYLATWLHVRVTKPESTNAKGEIIRHDPPIVTAEQRLFIVCDNGRTFGDGYEPMSELGFDVRLSEIPPSDKLLSAPALRAFRDGKRPVAAEVFTRLKETISRFIDFNRSLASQDTMAELVACYVMATWNLDAFNVIGFLWPNGDRGSGKTQLLTIICEMAYLGHVILAGGSYASLRDLADYGATLAFDDAESLADPRKTDPDKRALLLAGNRRGNTVPVKELAADKTWRTRHVNTYCPRLFSATRLPDPILASRTIVIPLIRTPDRYRANADPLDYKVWPHNRRQLIDDLWLLSLTHLTVLPSFETQVNENAVLTGRNLEPWRPILAVAHWLEANGVKDIGYRMEQLSQDYQKERPDLEFGDLTFVIIRALLKLVANVAIVTNVANVPERVAPVRFTTASLADTVLEIAREDEIEIGVTHDADEKDYKKQVSGLKKRIGHSLRKMRLKKPNRDRGETERTWEVTPDDIRGWALAYGIPIAYPLLDIGYIGNNGDIGNAPQYEEGTL